MHVLAHFMRLKQIIFIREISSNSVEVAIPFISPD